MKVTPLRKHVQCTIGLAAALAILPLGSAKAVLYWSADISRGTAVFNSLNIDETGGTVTVASDPLGQQGNVYKFYLPDETNGFGKERTESSGTETNGGEFLPAYNTEYYIGWRAMWDPMPINPGWVALMQMHGYGVTGQGAPLVLRCVNGDGTLSMQANANGFDTNIWAMSFHTNLWQGFVMHVLLNTNPAVGYVEFWVNGVQQTFTNGATRYYVATWDNADGKYQDSYNKLKWGVYRSGAMDGKGTATAWMCNAKVGSTYADVDPGIYALNGVYQIQNNASSKVLNNLGSTTNGSPIEQWTTASSSNLDWTFIPTSGGYYQINSSKSGKDAVVSGASTANGAGIVQWSFGSSGDDQWSPVLNLDNSSYTFYNLHSGLVLEDPGSSTNNTTQMDQWSSNGGSNQKWTLLPQ